MDSKAVLARFEAGTASMAMMDHPNIAKVRGGLTPTRRPFFVMELVNGHAADQVLRRAPISTPRQRLELFVPVCQAVQHAHQKGIVHRDLKPSNILVTLYRRQTGAQGDRFRRGQGDGRQADGETLSTQFGAVVGTLEYMSPEQAGFPSATSTPAPTFIRWVSSSTNSDGVAADRRQRLGKAAFDGDGPHHPRRGAVETIEYAAVDRTMRCRRWRRLRQIEPKKIDGVVARELDWVVMKCLEKDRDRRYETANGLARDIQHYLANEPVEACPPSVGYRFRKFVRRHKQFVAAGSLIFLALVVGIVGTAWGYFGAEKAREIAQSKEQFATDQKLIADNALTLSKTREKEAMAQTKIADDSAGRAGKGRVKEEELRRSEVLLYDMNIREAGHHWRNFDLLAMRENLDGCRWDLRGPEFFFLADQSEKLARTLWGHSYWVNCRCCRRTAADCIPAARIAASRCGTTRRVPAEIAARTSRRRSWPGGAAMANDFIRPATTRRFGFGTSLFPRG